MEGTVHEDLRIRRTREAIHKAFSGMLLKKNYRDITVKDLAKLANINRKTFYLHYDSLDELLEEVQQEMSDGFVRRIAALKGRVDMAVITREFFLYSLENKLKEHINCDESCRFISKRITRKTMEQNSQYIPVEADKYRKNIVSTFLSGATLEIFRQWVADGKKIPLEEIIELTTKLICNGVEGVERSGRLEKN